MRGQTIRFSAGLGLPNLNLTELNLPDLNLPNLNLPDLNLPEAFLAFGAQVLQGHEFMFVFELSSVPRFAQHPLVAVV
jgi:hypothetical protein